MDSDRQDEPPARPVDLTVVMPAHNEEHHLGPAVREVVAELRRRPLPFEVIVVENGSTDATRVVLLELATEIPELRPISLDRPDYGRSLRAGFLAAAGEVIVSFDVDFYDFDFLDGAMSLMRADEEVSLVVGTKRGAGARDTRGWSRRAVTASFAGLLRVGFGLRVSDTHGVKALRRRTLTSLVEDSPFGTDLFDTALVIEAERSGLGVTELPVTVVERRPSRTPISRRAVRTIVGLARLRRHLGRR